MEIISPQSTLFSVKVMYFSLTQSSFTERTNFYHSTIRFQEKIL